MVRDPHSGRYRRTRLFVLTLGYSRKAVRLLTFQSGTRTWAELHEQAFRRLGGTCRTVLDNLSEGVLKPDIYDPALNPLYRDLLAHYGDDLVFQSIAKGAPMGDNNILSRHIKPAARKVNLPWVNWQVPRRSCATWLQQAGVDRRA